MPDLKRTPSTLDKLIYSLPILLCTVMVGLVWYARNRGFCITDEAFYLLLSEDPQRYACCSTRFGFLLHLLPQLQPSQIADARIWQLIFELSSATILAFGFRFYISKLQEIDNWQSASLIGLAAMASLLIFSFFPLGISYNTLTTAFIFSAIGFFLIAVSTANKKILYACALSAGVAVGLCFFAKFSSSVLLFAALIAVSCAHDREKALRTIALISTGAGMGLVGYFTLVESPASFYSSFIEASTYLKNTGFYSLNWFVKKYVVGAGALFLKLLLNAVAFCAAVYMVNIASAKLSSPESKKGPVKILFITAVSVLILYLQNTFKTSENAVFGFYALTMFLVLAKLLSVKNDQPKDPFSAEIIAVLLLLLVSPFISSFGTNNDLVMHTKIAMPPLMVAGFFLAQNISQQTKFAITTKCFTITASVMIAAQFFSGLTQSPYGMPLPLAQHTEKTTASGLHDIKVCYGMREFFDKYDQMLKAAGFQKGDIVIATYNLPGLLFAVEANSIKFPTFLPGPGGVEMLNAALRELKQIQPKRFFVISNYGADQKIIDAFRQAGFDFPQTFEHVANLQTPFDAPFVDIETGQTDTKDLHNKISIFKFSK